MNFEKLIKQLASKNYGDLIMLLSSIVAITFGLLFLRKERFRVMFLIYIAIDFCFSLCDMYVQAFSSFTKSEKFTFIGLTNALLFLLELLLYFNFFISIIRNIAVKKALRVIAIAFTIIIVVLAITAPHYS